MMYKAIQPNARMAFLLTAVVLAAVTCSAGNITYNVNRSIGPGSVTGYIQTDGSIGTLTSGDIVNWNLTLNDGTNTFVINGGNSVAYTQGADLTASATLLVFNFSGGDNGIFLLQDGLFSGYHYYCAATQLGTCYQGETSSPQEYTSAAVEPRSGDIVIGSAVPEPGSIALLASGLLAGAGVLRRKLML